MQKKYTPMLYSLLLIIPLFSSPLCADTLTTDERLAEQAVLALNWYQQSGEFDALSYQAFNNAKSIFDTSSVKSHLKKAVVVDLDETLLDNSAHAGYMAIKGKSYNDPTWEQWLRSQQATALPGAVDFANYVNDQQATLFYVSNRTEKELASTMNNMKLLGFKNIQPEYFLLRGKTSNKQARFDAIAQAGYDVVLFIGDNLNDFDGSPYHTDNLDRKNYVQKNKSAFGRKFIMLPNPLYGNWEGALAGDYNKQSTPEKIETRLKSINAWESK